MAGRAAISVRTPRLDDLAGLDDVHPRRHGADVARVVGDHEGGGVAAAELLREERAHAAARGGVEGRHGLVEEQEPRLHQQRARQGDLLPLATGEGGGSPVRELFASHPREHLHRSLATRRARHPARSQGEGDVVDDPEMFEETVALGHVPDPPILRRHPHAALGVGEGEVVDRHLSRRARDGAPGDPAKEAGLAGAVGTDERDRGALAFETDVDVHLADPRPERDLPAHVPSPRRRRSTRGTTRRTKSRSTAMAARTSDSAMATRTSTSSAP